MADNTVRSNSLRVNIFALTSAKILSPFPL
jgi:hypothetical protein